MIRAILTLATALLGSNAAEDWVVQDSFTTETALSFGTSVAVFGESIAVGAPSGANGGSVFLYDLYNAENATEVRNILVDNIFAT